MYIYYKFLTMATISTFTLLNRTEICFIYQKKKQWNLKYTKPDFQINISPPTNALIELFPRHVTFGNMYTAVTVASNWPHGSGMMMLS